MRRFNRRDIAHAAVALPLAAATGCAARDFTAATAIDQTVWTFDRLESIGGVETIVEGAPKLIDSPFGRAVLFDGEDDALFIERHPLAGAAHFSFEAVFRPDGGAFEQRWFHLQQTTPDPGAEPDAASQSRIMFEIRVTDAGWYLDSFTRGVSHSQALIFPEKLHPIGVWTHVAQTYDGRFYRAYVNGVLEGAMEMTFTPQGQGRSSVGTRINGVNYFKGAVREGRFTSRALAPETFTMGSGR